MELLPVDPGRFNKTLDLHLDKAAPLARIAEPVSFLRPIINGRMTFSQSCSPWADGWSRYGA